MKLTSKGETLERLRPLVATACVLPSVRVRPVAWASDPERIVEGIADLGWVSHIVRSSAASEDLPYSSAAGKYITEVSVNGRDRLREAITTVFASYGSCADPADEVLVQPMIQDSLLSGVASGRDHVSGGPYRVINWTRGESTVDVTSGRSADALTWYGVSHATTREAIPAELGGVWALLDEIEELACTDAFEIEFCHSRSLGLVLLQARPLVRVVNGSSERDRPVQEALTQRIRGLSVRHDPSLGKVAAFGVMPDWNPAEMIGLRPRPLSASLYRTLITDSVWAEARRDYGYRDMTGVELMPDIEGIPYIDVRASLSSLVPADVDESVATAVVECAVQRLRDRPQLHDKVEFEVAVSCWGPGSRRTLDQRFGGKLDGSDLDAYAESLRRLTAKILGSLGSVTSDVDALGGLAEGRLLAARSTPGSVEHIALLVETTRAHGTLPFARLARAAFIATELLSRFVLEGILTSDERDALIGSASSVTSSLVAAYGRLTRVEFLARYGHLRPGTYDILSPSYDEAPDEYFLWGASDSPDVASTAPLLDARRLDPTLAREGLGITGEQFLDFAIAAIRGREVAKLEFTRNVSGLLQALKVWGAHHGRTPDDLSYLAVGDILGEPSERVLDDLVARGRFIHQRALGVVLPPVIFSPDDVTSFWRPSSVPNFVTQRSVSAEVARVDMGEDPSNKIACVVSADPGYDWIFARNIAGLVTAYGGVNSHMSIRAREFGIPAVTGCGEQNYFRWSNATRLEIDSMSQVVRILA